MLGGALTIMAQTVYLAKSGIPVHLAAASPNQTLASIRQVIQPQWPWLTANLEKKVHPLIQQDIRQMLSGTRIQWAGMSFAIPPAVQQGLAPGLEKVADRSMAHDLSKLTVRQVVSRKLLTRISREPLRTTIDVSVWGLTIPVHLRLGP